MTVKLSKCVLSLKLSALNPGICHYMLSNHEKPNKINLNDKEIPNTNNKKLPGIIIDKKL